MTRLMVICEFDYNYICIIGWTIYHRHYFKATVWGSDRRQPSHRPSSTAQTARADVFEELGILTWRFVEGRFLANFLVFRMTKVSTLEINNKARMVLSRQFDHCLDVSSTPQYSNCTLNDKNQYHRHPKNSPELHHPPINIPPTLFLVPYLEEPCPQV